MILIRRLRSLFRWTFRRKEMERRLREDLESFIELSASDKVRDGASPEEARRQARLEIGGVDQAKEAVRDYRWASFMDQLWQDLRYAFRSLAKQPGFTVVVVLILAIGIGANTAVYTVVDATILRTLPFHEPERLMQVSLTTPPPPGASTSGPNGIVWSYPKYQVFHEEQRVFEETALFRGTTLNLTGATEAERLRAEEVGAPYFPLLGVRAAIGRTFLPEEDAVPARDFVAVISHGLWQRQFGADPAIVGKKIQLDLQSFTVVGVLPAGFQGLIGPADVWVTVNRDTAESLNQPYAHAWELVARLKPNVSIEQAASAVSVIGKAIHERFPGTVSRGEWGARAVPLDENRLDSEIRQSVWVLFGAVLFVVLIACVNVANLLLARSTGRRREIAVRCAIGAGQFRVIRQLLTESLLLGLAGGIVSLVVAYAGVYALGTLNPAVNTFTFGRQLPGLTLLGFNSIRLDTRALVFTGMTALVASILFGLAPAWHAARTDLTDALKKRADRFVGFRVFSAKSVLVVLEIGLAFVLLAGAGLMIKSAARLSATQTGVDVDNILTVRVSLPPGPEGREASLGLFQELEQRVAANPGVTSVGVGSCHALALFCGKGIIRFGDPPPKPSGADPAVGTLRVSPEYFRTMKIPLIRGRSLTGADRQDTPKVVVVNQTAARTFWPGDDPVGKIVALGINGFGQRVEVVGVVGDVRYGQMAEPVEPDVYVSYLQAPSTNMLLFVRTEGDPRALIPAVRQQVQALNRNYPLFDIKTMQERVSDATARMRFNTTVLGFFAAIALALAGFGIFGVMSFVVRQSTREIGIRMALGARSQDVVRQELRLAAGLISGGAIIGLPGALFATRILESSLYQVSPADPPTYLVIGMVLAGVAMLASYLPARRASAVQPSVTLQAE